MAKKTFVGKIDRQKKVSDLINDIEGASEGLKNDVNNLENNPNIDNYGKVIKKIEKEKIDVAIKDELTLNLKKKYSDLETQYKKLNSKYNVVLIDYETSNNLELLNARKLSDDIKKIDVRSVEYLLVKCQRLYIISKHKLYKDLKYNNMEEFAEKEHSISRMQLYKYVAIFQKLEKKILGIFQPDNVKTSLHYEDLSFEKLYLLSRIEEKKKLDEWFDKLVEEKLSYRKLKDVLKENCLLPEKTKVKKGNKKVLSNMIKDFCKKIPKELNEKEDLELMFFIEDIFLSKLFSSKNNDDRKKAQNLFLDKLKDFIVNE